MFKIQTMNKISPAGLEVLEGFGCEVGEEIADPQGFLLRSADLHGAELPESLLAIARAGAGYNNIPVDACTERGIVVFNAPGANAQAVKEQRSPRWSWPRGISWGASNGYSPSRRG